jgi:hypothetical protein
MEPLIGKIKLTNQTSLPENKRNSWFSTILIFINCTCGLGFMTNPIFFAQSGWLLGSILILFVAYLVAYNMNLFCRVLDQLEIQNKNSNLVQMEDCFKYVFKSKHWQKVCFICKFN